MLTASTRRLVLTVAFLQIAQGFKLVDTALAPVRPEADQHHLPAILRQAMIATVIGAGFIFRAKSGAG
jgi:hypothetical protein